MRSSVFVKRSPGANSASGTRPGLNNQTLISSGLADLDKLLGGGLPLGTLTVVLEDGVSGHHYTLLKYYVAEGLSRGQRVFWAAAGLPEGSPGRALPQQARHRKQDHDDDVSSSKVDEGEGVKLRIAWQYERYIRDKQRSQEEATTSSSKSADRARGSSAGRGTAQRNAVAMGLAREWCNQYDLSRHVGDMWLQDKLLDFRTYRHPDVCTALPTDICSFVTSLPSTAPEPDGVGQSQLPDALRGPNDAAGVGRVAILSLGGPGWSDVDNRANQQTVLRTLFQLKGVCRERHVSALVTVPAGLFPSSFTMRLLHLSDWGLALEPMADDSPVLRLLPEPMSCCGLLHLRKACEMHRITQGMPDSPLFLLRHKRRRLSIEPLEIDPEKEFEEPGAAEGVSAKPLAALMCGGPAKADKSIEF